MSKDKGYQPLKVCLIHGGEYRGERCPLCQGEPTPPRLPYGSTLCTREDVIFAVALGAIAVRSVGDLIYTNAGIQKMVNQALLVTRVTLDTLEEKTHAQNRG